MRILLYTQEYPPEEGGIETYCASLARELVRRGHGVTVALRDSGDPREPISDAAEPVKVVRLRRYFKPAMLYRMYATAALWRLGRAERPDVLWLGHWFRHAAAGSRAARLLGIPVVITCHGEEVMFDPARPSLSDRRLRRGYRRAARVCANSRNTAERIPVHGIDPARVAVVPCGVEAKYFEAPDPARVAELRAKLGAAGRDDRVILSVGHLIPKKGHDFLIRALARLKDRFPGARVVVCGQGKQHGALEALARELGVADRVRLPGFVDFAELPVYYHASDLFALTTRDTDGSGRTEGFGIVYLEANAAGKPAVGGNSGGTPEAIADGESGLLCDAGSLDSVTDALARLLGDEPLRVRLGEQGRRRAREKFAWDRITDGFERVLEQARSSP